MLDCKDRKCEMCCETSKSRRAVIYIALQYSRNTQAHVLLVYGF
jgi:hypothetical protein